MINIFKTRHFFNTRQKERIIASIREAEAMTSGEIRVHVEGESGGNPLARAQAKFSELGMDRTEQRNGVLIYMAVRERSFAIVGDLGINRVVPANFWEETKDRMQAYFKMGQFVEGVCLGIHSAGEHLAQYFPRRMNDENELSDDISEG